MTEVGTAVSHLLEFLKRVFEEGELIEGGKGGLVESLTAATEIFVVRVILLIVVVLFISFLVAVILLLELLFRFHLTLKLEDALVSLDEFALRLLALKVRIVFIIFLNPCPRVKFRMILFLKGPQFLQTLFLH